MTRDQEYQITECLRELEAGVTPNQLLTSGYAAGAIIEALTRKHDLQIRTQEHNIKAAWVRDAATQAKVVKLETRVDTQQGMIEWQRNRIAELEAQLTPEAIAERVLG